MVYKFVMIGEGVIPRESVLFSMNHGTNPRPLKTIERTAEIIEALQRHGSGRISILAEELGLSPATVYNYLATLEQNRFVVKEGAEYRLGLRFLNVGGGVRHRHAAYKLAKDKVAQISEQTGERAQLLVEEHGRGVVLCIETGENAVAADTFVGKESYLHASAAGKAMLSRFDKDRVDAVIERWGLPKVSENTIVTEDALCEELATIRERGFAFNDGESIQGLRAAGVPIVDETNVLGALSLSGPAHRMKGDLYREEIPDILLGAANEIELNLTFGDTTSV